MSPRAVYVIAEAEVVIDGIREVKLALGRSIKAPTPGEADARRTTRKSSAAATDINPGEHFTVEIIVARRPGTGVSPMQYWRHIGREATRRYDPNELLS